MLPAAASERSVFINRCVPEKQNKQYYEQHYKRTHTREKHTFQNQDLLTIFFEKLFFQNQALLTILQADFFLDHMTSGVQFG